MKNQHDLTLVDSRNILLIPVPSSYVFLKSALLSTPADFERAAWHAGEHLSWCVLGFPPLSSSSAAHMKQNWRGKLKSKTHVFQSARCQIFSPPTLLKGGTGHVDSAASSWMVKINKCKAKKERKKWNSAWLGSINVAGTYAWSKFIIFIF